jgi:predicted O-methyltransferase YrrM
MALSSRIKSGLNRGLEPLNLKLSTRTGEKTELQRIEALAQGGQFDQPILPILPQFKVCDPSLVLDGVARHRETLKRFASADTGAYSFDNAYFSSPDADVAYAIARELKPSRIVEVGSGNSTFLFREAIRDGGLSCELVSIDPMPRKAVEAAADRNVRAPVEDTPLAEFESLGPNDFLFIDSSHEVKTGNDVVRLMLSVFPRLRSGVVVHIHDIFLPYEYPRDWVESYGWTEQYLVQAVLQDSDAFEAIWPGHYLQRTMPDFDKAFPYRRGVAATSLWLRRR